MNLAMSVKSCGFGLALLLVRMVAAQTAPRAGTPPVVACIDILSVTVLREHKMKTKMQAV